MGYVARGFDDFSVFPLRLVVNFDFSEFPASYKFSQRAIGLASCLAIFARPFFGPNAPPVANNIIGVGLGFLVALALSASVYVIVRYPYLSLVEPADGDQFTKHFGMQPIVYTILKCLTILTVLTLMLSMLIFGFNGPHALLMFGYLSIMLAFLVFHAFIYTPIQYPTIATFLRSTVGLGLLLLPFYLPFILIGSIRCRSLLDRANAE